MSLPMAAAISIVPGEVKPAQDDAEELADCLASLMRRCHGGDWKVTIDQRGEFILIAKNVG